ncbi:MAG: hypothetical protein IJU40_01305 [Desulfovibrionaceae bacterium]|nr:hypothetical protein [Desulfovibrionaceae bacterium]
MWKDFKLGIGLTCIPWRFLYLLAVDFSRKDYSLGVNSFVVRVQAFLGFELT